jgi:RNA polymerase sigma-70 factor, ECF subfamily
MKNLSQDETIRLVYPELREIAARLLRGERPNHTLQSTALVHESLLRLLDLPEAAALPAQELIALAAHRMRHILIDYGRRMRAGKRGGGAPHVPIEAARCGFDPEQLLELDLCLSRLGEFDRRALQVVELRFFAGLTEEEAARVLGVSATTVGRDYEFARAWLLDALQGGELNP